MDDPKIIAAIIAAVTSLLVSCIIGIYTILQNRRKFSDLRQELLIRSNTERFIVEKEKYLPAYKELESEVVRTNELNPNDGTAITQLYVDFFSSHANEYYLKNKSTLQSNELDKLHKNINASIQSGKLNNPDENELKVKFMHYLHEFCGLLNSKSLELS
jgi:hypothetical protein